MLATNELLDCGAFGAVLLSPAAAGCVRAEGARGVVQASACALVPLPPSPACVLLGRTNDAAAICEGRKTQPLMLLGVFSDSARAAT
eukprot:363330-Chlamydomonas_euryale.AAC.3